MKIRIVTPAPPGSLKGNRVTALRWARILKKLGHRVVVEQEYARGRADLLIALHARRSYWSLERFSREHPGAPRIVALTGTDLYHDIPGSARARRALGLASRIVVLQPRALDVLEPVLRSRTRVIYQSVVPVPGARRRTVGPFNVCVLGHLRPVKDPFRAALAARRLPPRSRIAVVHIGGALEERMAVRARAEEAVNPRYRWLGQLPRGKALRRLASSRLLALTSLMEGGANVLSEAIAHGVPVVASRIPGSIGILGRDYPGYFPAGDTGALFRLLRRAEADAGYYRRLAEHCRRLRPLFAPERELRSWKALLEELGGRNPM
jgi:putative glycosyltransferase (TIGR04348 family)